MAKKIDDFDKIPTVIYSQFVNYMSSMTFLFCYKTTPQEYYIFQEIRSLPLKKLNTLPNYTLGGAASWNAHDNIDALIVNANKKEVERWRDLLDNTHTINTDPNVPIFSPGWVESQRRRLQQPTISWGNDGVQSRLKKNKNAKKEKFPTFFEFKIIKTYAFYMFNWGFEILSDSINLFGVQNRFLFPHALDRDPENNLGTNLENIGLNNRLDAETGVLVQWSGLHFRIAENHPTMDDREMVSYWVKKDSVEDDFDKELEMLINRDKNSGSLSVGQRKVNLDV